MAVVQARQTQVSGKRPVGAMLAVGIFLFPILFAWFLLRKGYSATARVMAFGWMIVIVAVIIMRPAKDSPAPAATPVADASTASVNEEPKVKPWLLEGYTKVSDVASKSNVKAGFKRAWPDKSACAGATECEELTIIPAKACESLFVNMTIEDGDGNNIGFTNSMATNVAKYQPAKMIFTTYVEGARKFLLQEVSCRN